ncbi:unnamed protein product [Boreogadus saida]
MVEKKLGKRNFGFASLKFRLNRDMDEKGIVARDCRGSATGALPPGHRHRGTDAKEPRSQGAKEPRSQGGANPGWTLML